MKQAAVQFHDYAPQHGDFLTDVLAGFSVNPKSISPKYFYDRRGSELFDEICKQPEYYPTRTEISILQSNANEIAELIGSDCLLVELGSGASEKVRLLFESLEPVSYMGVDISREFLLKSTQRLAQDYPWLEVHAVCADFSHQLSLPEHPHSRNLVAFYPGSSIGNFEPKQAVCFLKQLSRALGNGGKLLIGVDLKKDKRVLDAAYNDAAKITEAFNLNLAHRVRDELNSDIDPECFHHHAFYNVEQGRVEMHLVSERDQTINICDNVFTLDRNESIHTENSYKYHIDEFEALALSANFTVDNVWTDPEQLFSVQLMSTRL